MKLTPVTIDFETFWSNTHTLSKMSPIEYVMHPETEIISMAIKVGNKPTLCMFGEEAIGAALRHMDWRDKLVIGHNMSGFDSMILAWRFGVRPQMWGCTLAMSRPLHMKDVGGSLKALVEHYGLGVKDQTALLNTKGRHLKDFTPDEIDAMRAYNIADVEQCYQLFKILQPLTPNSEMKLIDHTINMLVARVLFEVDVPLLQATLVAERERKFKALVDIATDMGVWEPDMNDEEAAEAASKVLASQPKFTKFLADLGVEPPMKLSPTDPNKMVPALAKTDEGFIALQSHPDPMVALAAQARLGVKSTLLETRIEKFLEAAAYCNGGLPVPLKYYGGHTGRWSGDQHNCQNLPRINPDQPRPTDALRNSLRAPRGWKVVVADLSGIELRVNHFLWQVPSSMALFQADPEKADLYKDFASKLYDKPVDEITKAERQIGKIAHLGLGFSAGAVTFIRIAKVMGGVDMPLEDAKNVVASWRAAYPEIVAGWRKCQQSLKHAANGDEVFIDPWEMCHTIKDGIQTPKGVIRYPGLRLIEQDGKKVWVCGEGRNLTYLTGGKVCENCLTADTEVLTSEGWRPIVNVLTRQLLWDGEQWVPHGGVKFMGVKPVLSFGGVGITHDHKVLVNEHWIEAGCTTYEAATSSCAQHYGHAYRNARSYSIFRREWEKESCLACSLRLRAGETHGVHRIPEREGAILRVPPKTRDQREQSDTWDVRASCVSSLELHASTLLAAFKPCLAQLRRSWDNCVRQVVSFVPELLGRYGTHVCAWIGTGSHRQRWPVLAGELPLDYGQGKRAEHTESASDRYPIGADAHMARRRAIGHWQNNPMLPRGGRLASGEVTRLAQTSEAVFDILNVGAKNRFTIRGTDGKPFIVHNCVQHLARHVLSDVQLTIHKEMGFRPSLSVHDELVYLAPEGEATFLLDVLQQEMRKPPAWWPELVTWSEGAVANTYGEAK